MAGGWAHHQEMNVKPTLKTISGLSGLAIATVSRALGDAPDISSLTKRKSSQNCGRDRAISLTEQA